MRPWGQLPWALGSTTVPQVSPRAGAPSQHGRLHVPAAPWSQASHYLILLSLVLPKHNSPSCKHVSGALLIPRSAPWGVAAAPHSGPLTTGWGVSLWEVGAIPSIPEPLSPAWGCMAPSQHARINSRVGTHSHLSLGAITQFAALSGDLRSSYCGDEVAMVGGNI